MRKALVRSADGYVVNVIEVGQTGNWPVPAGHKLLDDGPNCSPDNRWDGSKYVVVTPPAKVMTPGEQAILALATNNLAFAEIARRFGLI